ncbi:MAG: hypothetical protein ISS45_10900 [Candidatus Omnitrophica bacterium]|nr:hypothetical protein [Candidatus Omnitrophota bacterium]
MQPRDKETQRLKVIPRKDLFWFLKDGIQLDLTESSVLDMYVQQVITRGKIEDIQILLKTVDLMQLREALGRLGHFLPNEVGEFWEDYIGSNK